MYQKSNAGRVSLRAAALCVIAAFVLGQTAASAKPPKSRTVGRTSAEAAAVQNAVLLAVGNGVGLPVMGATLMQVIWGGAKRPSIDSSDPNDPDDMTPIDTRPIDTTSKIKTK